MYEYTYVKLELDFWTREITMDYHTIIEEHGRQGWRLVQIFTPPISSYGTAKFFELIFEKHIPATME